MKRSLLFVAGSCALLFSSMPAFAQFRPPPRPPEETRPPVMRALPARPEAVPAVPAATPVEIRRAEPAARPVATPKAVVAATPKPTPAPVIEPADPSEIRLSPQAGGKSADQAQLEAADSYYSRKMYEMAASEYLRYTEQYPSGADMQAALFRLAECYRKTGSTNGAKTAYDTLLSRTQTGDFIGPAAYRLADLYYQEKNYVFALPYFRKAALRMKEPAVVWAAKFYTARSLEALGGTGNRIEAIDIYKEIADAKETNPFQEASRLSVALLQHDAGRLADAVKQIKLLGSTTENAELKAEAMVRAGVWELDLQQPAKAAEDLQKALTMPSLGKWKEVAQVGLMRMYYDGGKYKQVLEIYVDNAAQFSVDMKPELLLLAANSQRQLNENAAALKLYDQLLKEFPLTTYGREASYQRLVTFYNADDDRLVTAIDDYLLANADSDKRDQILLMKAEALYKKQNYPLAAPIYGAVAKSRLLAPTLRAEALFKFGWCSMQTRDFDHAIGAFTDLIEGYPTFKSLSLALAQRAVAYQSKKDLVSAEKDYTTIIKKYAKSKERELALQQKAIIRGQLNDDPGMIENFELLLRDYPESPAVPEAQFWIGRSAYNLKDYKRAAEKLSIARKLNKEYVERASLPLILSYYYLNDKAAVSREVDSALKDGKGQVPDEVLRWLGEQYSEGDGLATSAKYLALLTGRESAKPRDFLKLGQAQFRLQNFEDSAKTLETYLQSVKEPPARAMGLLDLARARIGGKEFSSAQKSVDEALNLQPEGRLSGEARILAGDIQAQQGSWETAAKLYMSVAVTLGLDDEEVTPRALDKAVNAYQKAGKDPEAKKTLNTLKSRYPEYSPSGKLSQAKP